MDLIHGAAAVTALLIQYASIYRYKSARLKSKDSFTYGLFMIDVKNFDVSSISVINRTFLVVAI